MYLYQGKGRVKECIRYEGRERERRELQRSRRRGGKDGKEER
jgi:hypothetical protein